MKGQTIRRKVATPEWLRKDLAPIFSPLTQTATAPCPECEGEGKVEVEVQGGRYSSSFGNWLPDWTEQECETCNGLGEVERCLWCDEPVDRINGKLLCGCGLFDPGAQALAAIAQEVVTA